LADVELLGDFCVGEAYLSEIDITVQPFEH
jgi:hypothetical protein